MFLFPTFYSLVRAGISELTCFFHSFGKNEYNSAAQKHVYMCSHSDRKHTACRDRNLLAFWMHHALNLLPIKSRFYCKQNLSRSQARCVQIASTPVILIAICLWFDHDKCTHVYEWHCINYIAYCNLFSNLVQLPVFHYFLETENSSIEFNILRKN